ncbi:hypothetical protein QYM36_019433 [Artemia franciscana]|uniref:Uncharacterized protein n=1 Tax=Artemia franciscana TaxID=6661 RepID=A0AA88HAN4_ARTSF|nr:hypothetical protein QYM36_019433 [Artemia franciscana]
MIGLTDVDESSPLHMQLVDAITNAGQGATFGARVVALRYVFNWQLNDAGAVYARAKADYEHAISRRVTAEMAKGELDGRRMSLGWAQAIAEEAAYEQKLAYLLAEQRERSMRHFLQTLDASLDNFRTMRADERAADRAHSQGIGGGA